MATIRIELLRVTDGEPLLTAKAMSLLLGVPVADLHGARRDHTNNIMYLPNEWVKNGKRRTNEAMAHTGDTDLISGLTYWAYQDHGASIEIEADGTVYMVTPEAS